MPQIFNGRFAGKIEGDFVVFVIGMRINKLLLIHKWLPVAKAMPPMIRELAAKPELGFLHAQLYLSGRTLTTINSARRPCAASTNCHRRLRPRQRPTTPSRLGRLHIARLGSNGAVGAIYHEAYLVPAGQYESIYVNMPRTGLSKAAELIPAVGRMQSAKSRLDKE